MFYSDYTITISERQGAGYPLAAVAEGMGRVSDALPDPPAELIALIAQVDDLPAGAESSDLLTATGIGLFRWLTGRLETHLRVAWDRAEQQKQGLRVCLSIDAPEINAWPWELLHDPQRDHTFATSIVTPVIRYLDRADHFGSLANLRAELPMRLLLVLPTSPDLNLVKERAVIEQSLVPLDEALELDVLEGTVTRSRLADALVSGDYEIVHGSGHGSFVDGQGYIGLNQTDGSADWVDGPVMGRFFLNCKSLKLGVLNVCSSGKVDEGRAFQGLAPQLVRAGLPAVVAMQYPLTDDAAMTFAEEFYRRLCVGENAGRVDVAVTYARNMLAILYPGDRCFATPVIYTHAPDGVIFTLETRAAAPALPDNGNGRRGTNAVLDSLRASSAFRDGLGLADQRQLESWRQTLMQGVEYYQRHLSATDSDSLEAAQQGLILLRQRLQAIDVRLERV